MARQPTSQPPVQRDTVLSPLTIVDAVLQVLAI